MNRTPLHEEHVRLGAVLIDFHGWEMPVRYRSIPEEHLAVRGGAGLFDLCHMGRLELQGPDASRWLQRLITNDFDAIAPGRARYTLILNERGTILDDAIVYRLDDRILLVVNASNREKVIAWFESHREGMDARLIDRSPEWAMVAVQGPTSREIARAVLGTTSTAWDEMKYYSICETSFGGERAWVARTGYTGEDGYEIYLDSASAPALWSSLLETGGDGVVPVGLGARDTLRLEAGMPLCGNDIDDTTDPLEAGLEFAVKLDKAVAFVGKEALLERRARGLSRRLRGLRMHGRRAARAGMDILAGERKVGVVTSGAPSPTLGYPIAMGYIDTSLGDFPPALAVDVRGRPEEASLVPMPFFSRTRRAKTP